MADPLVHTHADLPPRLLPQAVVPPESGISDRVDELIDRIDLHLRLLKERERTLLEALLDYGNHQDGCPSDSRGSSPPCLCGWHARIDQIDAQHQRIKREFPDE